MPSLFSLTERDHAVRKSPRCPLRHGFPEDEEGFGKGGLLPSQKILEGERMF